jgi:hypothetical protein
MAELFRRKVAALREALNNECHGENHGSTVGRGDASPQPQNRERTRTDAVCGPAQPKG